MSIELLKDAKGREIPLDTKVLYDQDGDPREVARFAYTLSRDYDKWDVIFVNGYDRYASEMLLEPPDTWEKLEEDVGRAAERDVVPTGCRYFNAANKCNGCPLYGSVNCDVHRDERAFADIIKRIRKLRGED